MYGPGRTRPGPYPRWATVACALVLAVVTSGCHLTLTAGVDVRADGSGWVRAGIGFDEAAGRELGGQSVALLVDDLRQSGWTVDGPRTEADGLTWVRARKAFSEPAGATAAAAELSGPEGPFRDLQVRRNGSFLRTRTVFTGMVDLSAGLAGLSDPALAEALGGFDLGLDLEGLGQRFGESLGDAVAVRLEARLPGRSETWPVALGDQVSVELVSERWNILPLAAAVAALLFATAALVVVAYARRREAAG